MDGRRAAPCALKHPLSAYPVGVFYYESHVPLLPVRAWSSSAWMKCHMVDGEEACYL